MAAPGGVFVIGAWSEKDDRVKAVLGQLRRAGVRITHDWTVAASRGDHDAQKDKAGIDAASTVLFLAPLDPKTQATQAWWELGYAIGEGKHVVVAGKVRDWMIYARLADKKFPADRDALKWVEKREKGRAKSMTDGGEMEGAATDKPVLLDLSPGDVQGPAGNRSMISTQTRKALPESKFALPSQRKYPVDTAARTRNAAARLEQMKKAGKISDGDYRTARANIARAAKRFGIESGYNAPPKKGRRLHIRADIAHGGSLSVRHMSDRLHLDAIEVPEGAFDLAEGEDADDRKPVWIQIAKQGSFKGHPAGPFTLDEKVFTEIVRNFKSTINRRIPVDFEHASEQDPTSGSIPVHGAPAQGWVLDLKIQNGQLWGLVEWGARATEYIRSGAYRYISPSVRFGARDRVTGEPIGARLTSIGLVNTPFLDGMAPVAAKDASTTTELTATAGTTLVVPMRGTFVHAAGDYMPRLRAALRMGELSSAAECAEMLARLRGYCMDAGYEGTHEGIDLAAYCRALAEVVGGPVGTTWEQVFDTVEDLIDAAIDRHEIEMHPGEGPDEAPMSDDENEDTPPATMADRDHAKENEAMDQTLKEVTTQLKDTTAKLGETEAKVVSLTARAEGAEKKLSDAETKVSELTLKLSDATARAEKAEGENATLRDAEAKRAEAAVVAEVDAAFDFYKDQRKLTDAQKPHMLRLAKADIEAFRGIYAPVKPEHQHLSRSMTEERTPAGAGRAPAPNFKVPAEAVEDVLLAGETILQTTRRLMKDEKLPHAEAQIKAQRVRRAAGLR